MKPRESKLGWLIWLCFEEENYGDEAARKKIERTTQIDFINKVKDGMKELGLNEENLERERQFAVVVLERK